ncbi:ribonuclease Z [Alicyclobacillus fastidiosus]|uniref:Ribonuclease Z n=1 Tax=Alicyclobacillus fastidiosus TaxID=392011 RepID=A0ABV5AHD2_9BACL|nr:ribonuclease Z [Alicyclobacillus fastidiosus]WEH09238.1 ribonuclease Z [Alicyclobacillus fastidiosus]
MELYFLGTGAGMPSTRRNVTSISLRLNQERGTFWMIDCGEGTQQQVLSSPLKPSQLEKLFITHLHGDHLFGLPGLLGSRAFQGGQTPLAIYGPSGLREFVETSLRISETHLPYEVHVHEIDEGPIFEDDQFVVTCQKLAHGVPSYGYRIEERAAPGRLDQAKLEAAGIAPGPIYGQLKAGVDVTLTDGRVLRAKAYLSSPIPGRKIVILGDTTPCPGITALAIGADVLVHEATYASADQAKAHAHHHSTSVDAASAARESGVKALILTHVSARYDESALSAMVDEAQVIFPNTFLAADHTSMSILRTGEIKVAARE